MTASRVRRGVTAVLAALFLMFGAGFVQGLEAEADAAPMPARAGASPSPEPDPTTPPPAAPTTQPPTTRPPTTAPPPQTPPTAPAPEPTDDCLHSTIYGDNPDGGALAISPGEAVVNSVRIHNRADHSTAGMVFSVAVVALGAASSAGEPHPVVQWDVDGGRWQSVSQFYVPSTGANHSAYWNTPDMPVPLIPAGGSRLFRVRVAFAAGMASGEYAGVFLFAMPDCELYVDESGLLFFEFDPQTMTAHPTVPTTVQVAPTARVTPGAFDGGPQASPDQSVMPDAPHSSTSPPAQALRAATSRTGRMRMDIGMALAGACLILGVWQFLRWRRLRSSQQAG